MKKVYTFFFAVLVTAIGFAQPPQKMSYQCVVRNNTGGLVTNHAVGMKISILQGSPTGTVVFSETYTPAPLTNANGLLSVEIGSGTPVTGTLTGIDWAAGPYFFKTETDPAGGSGYTISGTSQLLSVPYALHAVTAENGFSGNYNDLINKPTIFNNALNTTSTGFMALISNTGGKNTAYGYHALNLNTTGYSNTANGAFALSSNTTGNGNTANGVAALLLNTTASGNTANGDAALYSNTTGGNNTANGSHALVSNTTGSNNTANGYYALNSNTTGYSNVAVGVAALYKNTVSSNLVAIGDSALFNNARGTWFNSSNFNTAVGSKSLYANTTGSWNTAIGSNSLYANTTGSFNTSIGESNLLGNITGDQNVAIGQFALYSNTTGCCNVGIGVAANGSNTTGSKNTAIGHDAGVSIGSNLENATALGWSATVNASNKVRIGNNEVTVIEGQVNWSVGSDKRLKDNIEYSDKLGLEFINNLKTATFTYKNDPNIRHHNGLIAQDVKQVLEKLGLEFSGIIENNNDERILNLSYAEFVIPLINAVQEQQKQIKGQQKEIDDLKTLVNSLIANQTVQGNK